MKFAEAAVQLAGLASSLLGWRPAEFWAATPAELATALGLGGEGAEPVDRGELERLLMLFPDNRES